LLFSPLSTYDSVFFPQAARTPSAMERRCLLFLPPCWLDPTFPSLRNGDFLFFFRKASFFSRLSTVIAWSSLSFCFRNTYAPFFFSPPLLGDRRSPFLSGYDSRKDSNSCRMYGFLTFFFLPASLPSETRFTVDRGMCAIIPLLSFV